MAHKTGLVLYVVLMSIFLGFLFLFMIVRAVRFVLGQHAFVKELLDAQAAAFPSPGKNDGTSHLARGASVFDGPGDRKRAAQLFEELTNDPNLYGDELRSPQPEIATPQVSHARGLRVFNVEY